MFVSARFHHEAALVDTSHLDHLVLPFPNQFSSNPSSLFRTDGSLYELCYMGWNRSAALHRHPRVLFRVAGMMLYSALMWPDSQRNLANLLARARLFVSPCRSGHSEV